MADSRWLMAIGEEPMADGVWPRHKSRWLMARQRTEGIFSAE